MFFFLNISGWLKLANPPPWGVRHMVFVSVLTWVLFKYKIILCAGDPLLISVSNKHCSNRHGVIDSSVCTNLNASIHCYFTYPRCCYRTLRTAKWAMDSCQNWPSGSTDRRPCPTATRMETGSTPSSAFPPRGRSVPSTWSRKSLWTKWKLSNVITTL